MELSLPTCIFFMRDKKVFIRFIEYGIILLYNLFIVIGYFF